MANDTNNETGKIQTSFRLDADLLNTISRMATEDDRSVTNMVERLLKTHPEVQERLEPEAVNA